MVFLSFRYIQIKKLVKSYICVVTVLNIACTVSTVLCYHASFIPLNNNKLVKFTIKTLIFRSEKSDLISGLECIFSTMLDWVRHRPIQL